MAHNPLAPLVGLPMKDLLAAVCNAKCGDGTRLPKGPWHTVRAEIIGRQRGAEPRAEEIFGFGIIFASQMGVLRGFHPCHIGTLDFALCRAGFSGWIFWRPFFGGIYCSYCRKTHTKNSGKISEEKFGENISFFGAFFGAFFGTFFGEFFGEQLFASKSEKFVQNPFCKRDPLRNYYWINSERGRSSNF